MRPLLKKLHIAHNIIKKSQQNLLTLFDHLKSMG